MNSSLGSKHAVHPGGASRTLGELPVMPTNGVGEKKSLACMPPESKCYSNSHLRSALMAGGRHKSILYFRLAKVRCLWLIVGADGHYDLVIAKGSSLKLEILSHAISFFEDMTVIIL